MPDIFLSYAREDMQQARQLAQALESLGWSAWWDRSIPAGKTFDEVIEREVAATRCMIVLWSQHSVTSRWVRTEAEEGAIRGILVPVLVERGVSIPLAFRRIQAADLIDWDGAPHNPAFQSLVSDISQILEPPPRAVPVQPTQPTISREPSPPRLDPEIRPPERKPDFRATGPRTRDGILGGAVLLTAFLVMRSWGSGAGTDDRETWRDSLPAPAPSQTPLGAVEGLVSSPEGTPLFAMVSIESDTAEYTAMADAQGRYRMTNLPPGSYTLTARYIGYEEATTAGIELTADQTQTVNLTLKPFRTTGPNAQRGGAARSDSLVDTVVDEPVRMIQQGPLVYPEYLRLAGVTGQVTMAYIVGANGKAEPNSFTVVSTTHNAFVEPAKQMLLQSLFEPAKVKGVPVRMRVQQDVAFTIQ